MAKNLRKKDLLYFVVGWKTDSIRGSVVEFEKSNSTAPGIDVEKALTLGCHSVGVELAEGADPERNLSDSGFYDPKTGRFFDPPLKDGVLTYHIIGRAPTGEVYPSTGRQVKRDTFSQGISVTPAYDVERALRSGSTSVFVGVNYEPSEDEIREREEDKRRYEEDEKKFQEFSRRTFHRGETIRGYCGYEKKEVELKNAKRAKPSAGSPVIEGTCASCGRQVHTIGRIE